MVGQDTLQQKDRKAAAYRSRFRDIIEVELSPQSELLLPRLG